MSGGGGGKFSTVTLFSSCFTNINEFYLGLNTRDGTNLDASRLDITFSGLGFDTKVYHNRTALQILTIVEQGKRFLLFFLFD
jgi:hypothetical protein